MPEHPYADIRDGKTGGEKLLVKSFEEFRQAVPVAKIREEGLEGLDSWPAWGILAAGLALVFTAPSGPFATVAERGAARGIALAPLKDPEGFELLPVRERAARWAAVNGADQLGIEERNTRASIRETIARSIREGTGREAARDIVAVRGFGLAPKGEAQLQKAVEKWRSENLGARVIRDRTRKLHRKLLLRRARGIWVYQKRDAIQEGARQAWTEALFVGQLTEENYLIWNHVGSAKGHPCPRCESLIGMRAGILADFGGRPIEGAGARYDGRQLVRRRPPEHPGCDCFLEVR